MSCWSIFKGRGSRYTLYLDALPLHSRVREMCRKPSFVLVGQTDQWRRRPVQTEGRCWNRLISRLSACILSVRWPAHLARTGTAFRDAKIHQWGTVRSAMKNGGERALVVWDQTGAAMGDPAPNMPSRRGPSHKVPRNVVCSKARIFPEGTPARPRPFENFGDTIYQCGATLRRVKGESCPGRFLSRRNNFQQPSKKLRVNLRRRRRFHVIPSRTFSSRFLKQHMKSFARVGAYPRTQSNGRKRLRI